MKKIYLITLFLIALNFTGCGGGDSSFKSNITTYSAGESFTVSKGDTVKNLSGDANITTVTDSETGITTVTVNSGQVQVL